jgi:hypothetical protein
MDNKFKYSKYEQNVIGINPDEDKSILSALESIDDGNYFVVATLPMIIKITELSHIWDCPKKSKEIITMGYCKHTQGKFNDTNKFVPSPNFSKPIEMIEVEHKTRPLSLIIIQSVFGGFYNRSKYSNPNFKEILYPEYHAVLIPKREDGDLLWSLIDILYNPDWFKKEIINDTEHSIFKYTIREDKLITQ